MKDECKSLGMNGFPNIGRLDGCRLSLLPNIGKVKGLSLCREAMEAESGQLPHNEILTKQSDKNFTSSSANEVL